MRALRPTWARVRVVVSVAALYALALQAVLGGVLSAGLIGQKHQLCLQAIDTVVSASAEGGPAERGPARGGGAHDHLACCTVAQSVALFGAPMPAASAIAWPERRATGLAWRPEVVAAPRAPPGIRPKARASPVV